MHIQLKKLDLLLLKSFAGPLVLTFFIALFVLVMQFLWKYVDDLVGKGLEMSILLEFMLYASAKLVPMALPLAVLLASIMTFGAMGEHYEIVAAKSSGIPLFRIMRPLIIAVIAVSLFAFFFSNNVLPRANLEIGTLLYDIKHQKPTLTIKEGIFSKALDGFAIRAGGKAEDGQTLYNMMVYDHSGKKGNESVVVADSAVLKSNNTATALVLDLYQGKQYTETVPTKRGEKPAFTSLRFDSWQKQFDMSQFELSRSDKTFFKDLYQMLNFRELNRSMDSIQIKMAARKQSMQTAIQPYIAFERARQNEPELVKESICIRKQLIEKDVRSLIISAETEKAKKSLKKATSLARNVKNYTGIAERDLRYRYDDFVDHQIEWHMRFGLSVSCLVLFFIGAPLGALIRKGGLGWPLFWSIVFFCIFHVSSMIGKKLVDEDVVVAHVGMWLSTVLLAPVGLFLTYKATKDSPLLQLDTYKILFSRWRNA